MMIPSWPCTGGAEGKDAEGRGPGPAQGVLREGMLRKGVLALHSDAEGRGAGVAQRVLREGSAGPAQV